MTVAIDRTKGDQSTPGNIIRGEGYALIRNSEATPDPDKVIHIPCADSFSVIVQLRDFNSHRLWNGNKLVFDGGHPRKSISIDYLSVRIICGFFKLDFSLNLVDVSSNAIVSYIESN